MQCLGSPRYVYFPKQKPEPSDAEELLLFLQGFTDPLKFDPDRFSPERQEDIKYGKNFLAFGHGPHYCVGKEYAINHLTAFLAILSMRCAPRQRIVYIGSRCLLSSGQPLPAML